MRAEGKTVVLVSHDLGAVSRFCDRALLLRGGEIVAIGEPDEVIDAYRPELLEVVSCGSRRSSSRSGRTDDLSPTALRASSQKPRSSGRRGRGAELLVVLNRPRRRRASGSPRGRRRVEGSPELGYAGRGRARPRRRPGRVDRARERRLPRGAGRASASCSPPRSVSPAIGSVAAQIRFARPPGHRQLRRDRARPSSGSRASAGSGSRPPSVEPRWSRCGGASGTLGLYRRAMLDDGRRVRRHVLRLPRRCRSRLARAAWRAGAACSRRARSHFHHHSATLGHGSAAKHRLVGRNRVRMLAKNATARQASRRRLVPIVAYDLLYVAHVAVTGRTLAPLTGRLRGPRRMARATGRRAAPGGASSSCRRRPACALRSHATASTGRAPCEPDGRDSPPAPSPDGLRARPAAHRRR